MRRLISDAVQIRPPAIAIGALLDEEVDAAQRLRAAVPTDSEVRDAAAKLARQMKDTIDARIAGQDGWTVGDLTVRIIELDLGEYALRGEVVIERSDT